MLQHQQDSNNEISEGITLIQNPIKKVFIK